MQIRDRQASKLRQWPSLVLKTERAKGKRQGSEQEVCGQHDSGEVNGAYWKVALQRNRFFHEIAAPGAMPGLCSRMPLPSALATSFIKLAKPVELL